MFEKLKTTDKIKSNGKCGLHKKWIYYSLNDYNLAMEYLQKINFSILDINDELEDDQFEMKDIVYIIVLVDWIKVAYRKLKSLVNKNITKNFNFTRVNELEKAKGYFETIRSYAVAHPLNTSRHSKYGFDGDFICCDIRSYDIYTMPFLDDKNNLFFNIDFSGMNEGKNHNHHYYFYSYSNKIDGNKFYKYISFSIDDILNVARLYIDALYELDIYLSNIKKKDYEVCLK